jgi:hypothetical protein
MAIVLKKKQLEVPPAIVLCQKCEHCPSKFFGCVDYAEREKE